MRQLTIVLVAALAMIAPARVHGWGFEAHQFVMSRAIDQLPAEIRPFFDENRPFIVEHTIDPDLWRLVGFTEESPHHFLDIDAYGAYPFKDLPRDYDRALEKYGFETLSKNGLLPWRTAEVMGWLRRAFVEMAKNPSRVTDVKLFSAVLGHYVSDGHVPFHAVVNYDGQLTGQSGIHARWESELFTRYRSRLVIKPPPVRAIPDVRDFVFETLLTGFQLVPGVLEADRKAIGSREEYDDRYFDEFFAATRPTLERRLNESIAAVASAITTAWQEAGKPAIVLNPPQPVRRKRAR
ncbi:MAG TPA: hypothetical protein VH702_15825 [Vicinamibacterales bacterium]|jgi:hypothetical protein